MKVTIAVPCFDMLSADFAFSLTRLIADQRGDAEVLDIRGSEIAWSRNKAARHVLETGSTHLMFLDSDMCFPADTLRRLLAWGKPIVGASYIRRCEPFDLLGEPLTSWKGDGLVEAKALPTGCLLINAAVLRRMSWPWFKFEYGTEYGERVSEDIYFCREARRLGMSIWCDTGLTKELGHVGVKRYTVQDGIEHIARKMTAGKRDA